MDNHKADPTKCDYTSVKTVQIWGFGSHTCQVIQIRIHLGILPVNDIILIYRPVYGETVQKARRDPFAKKTTNNKKHTDAKK